MRRAIKGMMTTERHQRKIYASLLAGISMNEKSVEHMKTLPNRISFLSMAKARVIDGDMSYKIIAIMRSYYRREQLSVGVKALEPVSQ